VLLSCKCNRIRKEEKCGASKSHPVLERKTLPCDEECARLARNAALAAALHISDAHVAGEDSAHVPYAPLTLEMYKQQPRWCAARESEIRLFAADEQERRLRFKPMSAGQRQFLHSLADDLGLESESVDPEPHRHVVLLKGPGFVAAPVKTLAQCVKSPVAAVGAMSGRLVDGKKAGGDAKVVSPFNAFVLSSPRFALTLAELREAFKSDASTAEVGTGKWKVEFLPSEEVVLAPADLSASEGHLRSLKTALQKVVSGSGLATAVHMCTIDSVTSLNITRREESETSDGSGAGGWSTVVKGAAKSQKPADVGLGTPSGFAVLGGRLAERKREERLRQEAEAKERKARKLAELEKRRKLEREVEVAEDWEVEEEKLEGAEGSGGEEGAAGAAEKECVDGNEEVEAKPKVVDEVVPGDANIEGLGEVQTDEPGPDVVVVDDEVKNGDAEVAVEGGSA
jgi:transcriptional repressor NF-X1